MNMLSSGKRVRMWLAQGLVLAASGLLAFGAAASGHSACKASKKSGHSSSPSCAHKGSDKEAHKKGSRHSHASKHASIAAARAATPATAPALAASGDAALPADAASNPRKVCLSALASSKASQRVAAKAPFFASQAPSAAVLADRSRPSKAERKELNSVIAAYELCLDMSQAWARQTYPPDVLTQLDTEWHDIKSILNDLQAGKRSYGEAAQAVADTEVAHRRATE